MKHDIGLVSFEDAFFIDPLTAVGLLWLQYHFPIEEWPHLSMGAAFIDCTSASMLAMDAEDAGLSIGFSKSKESFIPGFHD
jgi:hypothetical protein